MSISVLTATVDYTELTRARVDRVDKSLSVFELNKTSLIKNTNAFNEDYVISVLANNYTPRPPLMAHLIFDTKKQQWQ